MFRDSNGKVGLLAEKCSHRRASLFYGRNEECGLRCIYHGWKYDVEGNIVATPAEPAESMIRRHVKHVTYPVVEVNQVVAIGLFYDVEPTLISARLVNVTPRPKRSTQAWNAHEWDWRG